MVRVMVAAALVSALCATTVHAQYGGWPGGRLYAQQSAGPQRPARQDAQRERPRGDGDRRSLTPDERRELRRDLQRANQEIYRKGKARRDGR
jgi:hypothetical protein